MKIEVIDARTPAGRQEVVELVLNCENFKRQLAADPACAIEDFAKFAATVASSTLFDDTEGTDA